MAPSLGLAFRANGLAPPSFGRYQFLIHSLMTSPRGSSSWPGGLVESAQAAAGDPVGDDHGLGSRSGGVLRQNQFRIPIALKLIQMQRAVRWRNPPETGCTACRRR